ncbi:intraflagellar transport protein 20 homolog isoform X1 [Sparus aurata]|uniref:Intraflagellar transport 20 homolog (Chlamydomonas) n=1 Tax=Sparus aurata TaxID=8175 RepID=A0A671V1U5_SPAAU|nr:intraflagellar transport protein 20 homolog isoform X1 [Sparus aurata]
MLCHIANNTETSASTAITVITGPVAMAKDPLAEAGFYFDELNKLRVLEPDVSQKTSELKEECKEFVDKIGQFQKIVGGLIELVDELAKEAETEKMKAIGARNLLKSVAKQREAQQQQLQALIAEKKMQLERFPSRLVISSTTSQLNGAQLSKRLQANN